MAGLNRDVKEFLRKWNSIANEFLDLRNVSIKADEYQFNVNDELARPNHHAFLAKSIKTFHARTEKCILYFVSLVKFRIDAVKQCLADISQIILG